MSRLGQILTVLASTIGLSKAPTSAPVDNHKQPDATARAAVGHRYGSRISEGGNPPCNWGQSAACRQMVRKNRHLALRQARYESPKKGGRPCTVKN